jgi:hypothetical protein
VPGEGVDECGAGGFEAVGADGVEAVEDEQDVGGGGVQAGADALPPVPAAAGDPEVVAPHHLSGVDRHSGGYAVRDRFEGLVTVGADQAGRADVAVEVLPAEGDEVLDRDGVVEVGEAVDAGEPGVDAAKEGLDAAAGLAGFDPKPRKASRQAAISGSDSGGAPLRRALARVSARVRASSLAASLGPPRTPVATMSRAR